MSADNIVQLSREIRSFYESQPLTERPVIEAQIKSDKKYDIITTKYPAMVRIICSDNYDQERLEYMIRLSARVRSGDIEEKVASIAVGQRLVDEIVKPQIEKNKK
jgi:hypothetical protein